MSTNKNLTYYYGKNIVEINIQNLEFPGQIIPLRDNTGRVFAAEILFKMLIYLLKLDVLYYQILW